MYIIFRIILLLLHYLYSFYYSVKLFFNKLTVIIYHILFNEFPIKQTSQSIKESTKQLIEASKFPKHLAVILGHEEVSIFDLVRLLSWCVIAEIPCISLYDHTGMLVKNQNYVKRKIDQIDPFISKNIKWLNSSNSLIPDSNSNNHSNNLESQENFIDTNSINVHKYKTRVKILSYVDGKSKMASLTKNLAYAIEINGLKVDEITSELINEKLSLETELPDPDIAIVFGETMSTYGFLPWHTRVTEFFLVPTHYNLSCKDFIQILSKYGKCEQRYGK